MGHFLVVVVIRFALDSAVDLSTEPTRISQTRCGMEVLWVPTAILRGDSWLLISPSTATGAGMDRKLGFAFRRPSSGGTEDAEPAQYLAGLPWPGFGIHNRARQGYQTGISRC